MGRLAAGQWTDLIYSPIGIRSANGATYVYDAEGNRVSKSGVGITDTVYFGSKPIARLQAGQWTDLIYGPNGLLAEVPGT